MGCYRIVIQVVLQNGKSCQLKAKNLMLISKVSKEYTGFPVGWSLFTEVCMCNIQNEKKKVPSYFKTEKNCTAIQWLCLYKQKKDICDLLFELPQLILLTKNYSA